MQHESHHNFFFAKLLSTFNTKYKNYARLRHLRVYTYIESIYIHVPIILTAKLLPIKVNI